MLDDLAIIYVKQFDDGEHGFDLDDIFRLFTVRKDTIKYYSIEELEDGAIAISFYNKNRKKIKLRRRTK